MGTCLGFESMTLVLSGYELKLQDSLNIDKTLQVVLKEGFYHSRLINVFSEGDDTKFIESIFYFNHHYGFLMADVPASATFDQNATILATYLNEKNEECLGMFEHKVYPFVGW